MIILALILSIMGIAITLYISLAHLLNKKVVYPLDGKSCNIVLGSKYSKTLGIKNEFIGLIYYIAIITALFMASSNAIILTAKIASGIAAAYSIILFGIQIKIIKSYCFWCISTAIINILLFIYVIRL